jgi:hypothetical protein
MPTGLVVWILVILLWVGVCFLAMLSFLGRVRSRLVSRSQPPSLNIRLCRMLVLKLYGFKGC